MSEEKIIHQFKKNANETVMVKFTQFKGRRLIDIRAYYAAENGDLKPTQKGLSFRRDLILELREAINKALRHGRESCLEGQVIRSLLVRSDKLSENPSLTMDREAISWRFDEKAVSLL